MLLRLSNISKRYGATVAADEIDLVVRSGEVVALTGPNGSGKTTTLNVAAGLLEPDAGSVASAALALVPDLPAGFDELTVRELLDLHAAVHRVSGSDRPLLDTLLDALRLRPELGTRMSSLSHGRRRQVAIAAAASTRKPLLLIDEATAALDPEAVAVLREIVAGHAAAGGGVLIATQDLPFAETVAHRVVLLRDGRCLAQGTLASLRTMYRAPSLEQVFLSATGADRDLGALRAHLATR